MSTITDDQQAAIAAKLESMTLPSGLGDEHNACSIAAINLALTGELTDDIPACMSLVIGKWVIVVQDAMPAQMRNSHRWKSLLPLAAGTGRALEPERLALTLDWMWDSVLPTVQASADAHGFGSEWLHMITERTAAAEAAAAAATWAGYAAKAAAATWAARAALDAKAAAAEAAAAAATWAARAAAAAEADAEAAAEAAGWSARAAARAALDATWEKFDPCGLLERLVSLRSKT